MAVKLARLEPAPDLPQVDTSPAPPPRAATTPPDLRPKARPETRDPPQKPRAAAPARQASGEAQEKIRGTGGAARTQSNDAARTNALRAQWGAAIYAKVQRNLNAPRGSPAEGTAKLALRVASNGSLQGLSLTRSSGSADLDRAALAAIKRAGRFAKAPQGLGGDSHDFSLSLTFTR
jgi:protein TonB